MGVQQLFTNQHTPTISIPWKDPPLIGSKSEIQDFNAKNGRNYLAQPPQHRRIGPARRNLDFLWI